MSPQVKDGRRRSGAVSFLPPTEAFCCMCTYTGNPVVISHFFLLNPGRIWYACFAIKPINVTCCNQSTDDEAARLPVELCFHEVTRAFSLLTCLDLLFFSSSLTSFWSHLIIGKTFPCGRHALWSAEEASRLLREGPRVVWGTSPHQEVNVSWDEVVPGVAPFSAKRVID